jgi:peptidyl-tRNA hydrolase
MPDQIKQIIVVNESLKLPKGKLAAQVAHAVVAAFLEATEGAKRAWLAAGMPKVVLRGESAGKLAQLEDEARRRGIPARRVADAGRTVIPAGTITCLGLGPADADELNVLTGGFKLLR